MKYQHVEYQHGKYQHVKYQEVKSVQIKTDNTVFLFGYFSDVSEISKPIQLIQI